MGHGAHAQGLAAGSRSGVAKGALVHSLRVVGPSSYDLDDVLDALTYVADSAPSNQRSVVLLNLPSTQGLVSSAVNAAVNVR